MTRWSTEQATAWHAEQPWLRGCNFIPSNAINQLEMWQSETFDPATIDSELAWAADLGMNSLRVYLHHLAWSDVAGNLIVTSLVANSYLLTGEENYSLTGYFKSSGSTPPSCLSPFSPCSSTTASPRARITTRAAPVTTPATSRV